MFKPLTLVDVGGVGLLAGLSPLLLRVVTRSRRLGALLRRLSRLRLGGRLGGGRGRCLSSSRCGLGGHCDESVVR